MAVRESFDVGRVFPDDSAPPPPTSTDALRGSFSEQVRFSAGGEPVEKTNDTTVVLSQPWRPVPWDGEPIRFLLVYDRVPRETNPRDMTFPSLRVRLADGRVVLVPH